MRGFMTDERRWEGGVYTTSKEYLFEQENPPYSNRSSWRAGGALCQSIRNMQINEISKHSRRIIGGTNDIDCCDL